MGGFVNWWRDTWVDKWEKCEGELVMDWWIVGVDRWIKRMDG